MEPARQSSSATRGDATAQLKQAVRGGTGLAAAAQVGSQLTSFLVLAFLYRLVAPADFGLLGMVIPLLMFLRIFSTLGLNIGVVQRADLSPGQLSNLYWLQLVLGAVTSIVTAALAPTVAWFYAHPELVSLTVALAPTALSAAAGAQHQALLERQLRFGPLAVVRLLSQFLGGLAGVLCAWFDLGVWALVVQQHVELLLLALLAWYLEPWRPQRYQRAQQLGSLLRFGGHYSASTILFFIALNIDKVLVGYTLGQRALGYYSQAFNLMFKPVYVVTTPLTSVMLPALARAIDNRRAFEELFLAFHRLLAITLLPTSVGLMLVAPEAMLLLGGPQWQPAAPLLRAFAAAILVQGFVNVTGTVLAAIGRADRLLVGAGLMTTVLVQGYLAGLWFGRHFAEQYQFEPVLAVAAAYSIVMILVVFLPYLLFCLRTVHIPLTHWLQVIHHPALASLGMGLVVAALRSALMRQHPTSTVALLAAQIAAGVVVYALLARREITWLVTQWRATTRSARSAQRGDA